MTPSAATVALSAYNKIWKLVQITGEELLVEVDQKSLFEFVSHVKF